MTHFRLRSRRLVILDVAMFGLAITIGAIVLGHPAVAEVLGGGLIVWLSVLIGTHLTRRAAEESDPSAELILDLALVLIVIVGLVGVGVMAVAVP